MAQTVMDLTIDGTNSGVSSIRPWNNFLFILTFATLENPAGRSPWLTDRPPANIRNLHRAETSKSKTIALPAYHLPHAQNSKINREKTDNNRIPTIANWRTTNYWETILELSLKCTQTPATTTHNSFSTHPKTKTKRHKATRQVSSGIQIQ